MNFNLLWSALSGFFLVATLSAPPARAEPASVARYAIVIGNNQPHENTRSTLRYADDDALATHRLLREAGVHSFLLVRLDADSRAFAAGAGAFGLPRSAELERARAQIGAAIRQAHARGESTELFLFYSGHGDVERGEGFLALEDGKLTRSMLFDFLSGAAAQRNHVFIDACKSYFLAFDRGAGGHRRAYLESLPQSIPGALDNTGFVLSTSSDRESHEWERYQGGILSHQLRSALRGAADANLDGRITYAEVGAFLTTATSGIKNVRFRPDFMVRAPNQDLRSVVLSWPGKAAPFSTAGREWDHFYLESGTGERLLDAHPAPGQPLALWLPEERPLFVRRHDGQAEYVLAAHEPVRVEGLTPVTPVATARGAINLAFEQLFAVPFGTGDVERFELAERTRDRSVPVDEPTRGRTYRILTGGMALAALAGGITLSARALAKRRANDDASMLRRERANEDIRRFNRASAGAYAAAIGLGVLTWWWPFGTDSFGVSLSSSGSRQDRGFSLRAHGNF